ncbi:MAG: SGNH/GDSL hydrolase family protein [Bacteroidales bacterium]|nr:SGNH/GDSL hydrolase family protein [Bacteroidales bacterium]
MKKFITLLILVSATFSGLLSQTIKSANLGGYDTTRLYNVFIKAMRGDTITIVYLGGSITQGYAASTEAKRWANRVTAWWEARFPAAHIKMVNAGIGGTGSDIGMFRLQRDVLKYNPDLVFVEFSVNDAQGTWATTSMEGLIRQLLKAKGYPAVVMLMLKQANGTTAKASHQIIGNYYKVPMVSFADLIDSAVTNDGISLESIFVDGLHPNDAGMQYIATLTTDELEKVYTNVPDTSQLLVIDSTLPQPYVSNTYDNTYMYTNTTLVPVVSTGWEQSGSGWVAKNAGDEIVFEIEGNSIAVLFSKHNNAQWGSAEMWVEGYPKKTFDAYWTQTWGPATVFGLVQDQLPNGKHKLHIKITETMPAGSSGHTFYLLNVLKAGNIGNVAPIAIPSTDKIRLIKNSYGKVNASKSYDSDGGSITHFIWTIVSQPKNSLLNLTHITNDSIVVQPNTAGVYKVGIQVSDAYDTSVMKIITIEVRNENHRPVAVAGQDTSVKINTNFFLNGYRSNDLDNDDLSYTWRVIDYPEGSKVIFGKPNGAKIPVKVDREGIYLFGLTVFDGFENSFEDTLVVAASVTSVANASGNNILVYPNPARNLLNIKASKLVSGKIIIEVFTIDGKLCVRKDYKNSSYIQFPLSNLKKGFYWIKITNGEEYFKQKLFVL